VRAEIEHRYGEAARVFYYDTSNHDVRLKHARVVELIHDNHLEYPVTVINGEPVYEGAVSYPAILRAVQTRLNDVC